MALFPHQHETIEGVGRLLRRSQTTCVQVLERCLDRIEEWEPRLKAWVIVDRERALETARSLDQELVRGECRGPLHGIPLGVKDIIDVEGLPTAAGFGPWKSRVATKDSGLVASLRAGGAVVLGKTVSTQFAWIDPPVTRNPWNLERTPGGSSSGSAAAVAMGMCLGALGTQTGGSIIRPASFCGVAGLKPTYAGRADGIVPFSPSLDHPGPLARSIRDVGLIFREFLRDDAAALSINAVDEYCGKIFPTPVRPPRLARLRGAFESKIDPVANEACDRAVASLVQAGAVVTERPLPFDFDEITQHHRVIMAAEAAAVHAEWFANFAEHYKPRIRELIEEGERISARTYIQCREHQDTLRIFMSEYDQDIDAMVLPSTLGPAPGPETTGSPLINSLWSYAGNPALTFPLELSNAGLPLGIQLVAPRWLHEDDLIATAAWCESMIRGASRPSPRRV